MNLLSQLSQTGHLRGNYANAFPTSRVSTS